MTVSLNNITVLIVAVLLTLKLMGTISISWWLVFLPVLVFPALIVVIMLVLSVVALVLNLSK